MTSEDIKAMDKPYLIPKDVAPLLGCDPYTINVCAKQCPERLGFPVILMGSRVRIPREGFIRFWMGETVVKAV